METTSTKATPQTPARDWAAEIAKAKARLKRIEAKSTKEAKAKDTRRKVLAGVAILNAMKDDKDLRLTVLPAMQAALSEKDWETLAGLVGVNDDVRHH